MLKEISEPAGAVIRVKDFTLGDPTISVLELWGAEYQESNALLVRAENRDMLQGICDREKVPVSFVGAITGEMQHKYTQTLWCMIILHCDIQYHWLHLRLQNSLSFSQDIVRDAQIVA